MTWLLVTEKTEVTVITEVNVTEKSVIFNNDFFEEQSSADFTSE